MEWGEFMRNWNENGMRETEWMGIWETEWTGELKGNEGICEKPNIKLWEKLNDDVLIKLWEKPNDDVLIC